MKAYRALKFVALEALALGLGTALATASAQSLEPPQATVVAKIGNESITWAQLLAHGKQPLAAQHAEHELAQLRLDEAGAHQRYNVLEADLGQWLDERALAAEAAVQHSSTDALLAAITPDPVNEPEMRQFYEARKGTNDPGWDIAKSQIGERVQQLLVAQHVEQAHRRYLDGLRALHSISADLPPYRVAMPADGQARGKASAPVTLVEFSDFQCPYCQRAQPVLQALLAMHPDELRLVFHHFPLARLHPNARGAAFAAECARQQQHFWEMHDAMYADQDALSPPQLQATAARIGLEPQAFARCIADPATVRVVDADLKLGASLGVSGTPSLYINGRPVASDPETLERVVGEELAQVRAH
jgi:protein-disulfide isomerase